MANEWYPIGGSGGIPSDMSSSEVIGDRRLKIAIDDKLIEQGNNLDRLYVQNLDYRDDVIAQGIAFYVDYEQPSIAVGAKTYVEVTAPIDKYIAIIDREVLTDQERLFYKVYGTYDPVTLGASVPIKNLRTNSPFTSDTTINECSAPASIDTSSILSNVPVFGAVGAGNRASGGISGDALFRLIEPGKSLLFEWENQSATAIYCKTMIAWFELPESAIIT